MRSPVAGKARVHELAKELGVESKVVLAKLKEMGEFVKSASSTVEAPVARKLKEAFPAGGPPAADAAPARRPGPGPGRAPSREPGTPGLPPRPGPRLGNNPYGVSPGTPGLPPRPAPRPGGTGGAPRPGGTGGAPRPGMPPRPGGGGR